MFESAHNSQGGGATTPQMPRYGSTKCQKCGVNVIAVRLVADVFFERTMRKVHQLVTSFATSVLDTYEDLSPYQHD
jgi:hypothetical protein